MKPIQVALVGCGRISELHEIGYKQREDARIVALCDSNLERAQSAARRLGVDRVYTDYDHVLHDKEVDLVELLVPHSLHADMTVRACDAGKHVSVQKPMANSVAEADQMIAAATRNRVHLRIYETFVFYPPAVLAKKMLDAGEIGEPQMIRIHVNTGKLGCGWQVPLDAWIWRLDPKTCGGGPLVFDHGYHLFSLAHHLMGPVAKVCAWIDTYPDPLGIPIDAPATIMVKFKTGLRYGVMDFAHTPNMHIDTDYYADDDRIEIIGDRGILFINRYTARTVDLPELMLFRDGKTQPISVDRVDWSAGFVDCTHHFLDVLHKGGTPVLDGPTGKAVLQFTLATLESARTGKEVNPENMK